MYTNEVGYRRAATYWDLNAQDVENPCGPDFSLRGAFQPAGGAQTNLEAIAEKTVDTNLRD